MVTSSVGAVIAPIGQLFHRRADIALRHMTGQTEALRPVASPRGLRAAGVTVADRSG
ncbi:hypothetical protein [Streptomyces sp. NPDC002215]|uniref:hypothetical protein n=1 Tax=Streptomyces sp. NPDC002215 TaxID=3154412 RepID=UPI003321A65A